MSREDILTRLVAALGPLAATVIDLAPRIASAATPVARLGLVGQLLAEVLAEPGARGVADAVLAALSDATTAELLGAALRVRAEVEPLILRAERGEALSLDENTRLAAAVAAEGVLVAQAAAREAIPGAVARETLRQVLPALLQLLGAGLALLRGAGEARGPSP